LCSRNSDADLEKGARDAGGRQADPVRHEGVPAGDSPPVLGNDEQIGPDVEGFFNAWSKTRCRRSTELWVGPVRRLIWHLGLC
jgi:hypothetical protein